jgi:hypothetical protein
MLFLAAAMLPGILVDSLKPTVIVAIGFLCVAVWARLARIIAASAERDAPVIPVAEVRGGPPQRETATTQQLGADAAAAHAGSVETPLPPARYESPTWRRWREGSPPVPPLLVSRRERLADLIGSMLLAVVVVSVVSLVVVLYRMGGSNSSPVELNQYAWLALSAVAGAWSIMIPSKIWEFRPADAALRRFVMLAIGLGVGLIAYSLYGALLVHLPYDFHDQSFRKIAAPHFPQNFYGPDGAPSGFAFLAYFGLLWLIPRWWRQAYSRRSTRLSLWSAAVSLFWAAAVNCLSPFPQPWGLMFAVTVSIAVQLASPWQTKKA